MRCHYCDTAYAFTEGEFRLVDEVVTEACSFPTDLVEITGGEPLMQSAVHLLMQNLCDLGKTVLIETGGAYDISVCDSRVIRILDIKTPGSGEEQQNHWPNLDQLRSQDEVKLVICDRADFEWALQIIQENNLQQRVGAILMSPVFEQAACSAIRGHVALDPATLAQWIVDAAIPGMRMQMQMHKFIWDPQQRGV